MNWYLHIQQNDEDGPVVRLAGSVDFSVGRGRDCDLRIRAPKVSRKHCRLLMREGKWHVEDLNSRNGTSVNNRPVTYEPLREGDEIQIGGVDLTLLGCSATIRGSLDSTCDWLAKRVAQEREEQGEVGLPQPQLLGRRYARGEPFHQGAAGSFYKARDVRSERTDCVKLFAKHILAEAADLERFVRGARTAGKLHHLNIVRLYQAGRSHDDRRWLPMQYVDGPSARQLAHEVGVGDCRSDIYGLDASLYALLTGRLPFHARGRVELIDRVRNEDRVPPGRVHLPVPAALEGLVVKCLTKHPTDRFANPGQLAQELERLARFRNI